MVQVAVAIVNGERSSSVSRSKVVVGEKYKGRQKRLWLVILTSDGRFKGNQTFAGATEFGEEMKCQAWQTGAGGEMLRWRMGIRCMQKEVREGQVLLGHSCACGKKRGTPMTAQVEAHVGGKRDVSGITIKMAG